RDIDYLLRQSEAATIITIRGFKDVDYVDALVEGGATGARFPTPQRLVFIGENTPAGFMLYADLRARAAEVTEAQLDEQSARIGIDDVINMKKTWATKGF